MKKSILIAICLALCGFIPAAANVIYVDGNQTGSWAADTVIVTGDVRVPPGQTLSVQPGVKVLFWSYCKITIDTSAVFTAIGTVADTIYFDEYFSGNRWKGLRFILSSDACELQYCSLKHGSATGSGEDSKGGAVYCNDVDLTIGHCLFNSNSASGSGGTMYVKSNSTAHINNSTFNANSQPNGGGTIRVENCNPNITYNTISGNSSPQLSFSFSTAQISNNTITNGLYTSYQGGGIKCESNANVTITNNTISGNTGYYDGGGIWCSGSSPIINSNLITNNGSAWTYGGAIELNASNPQIVQNTISGNSSSGNSGTIDCYSNSNPLIDSNAITGNSGVGVFCYSSSPIITNNTITSNTPGGISCNSSSPAIRNNIIRGNYGSGNGGGISLANNSRPVIKQNTIRGNSAANGGGIYCSSSTPDTLSFNEICRNTATSNGGGIYFSGSNPLTNKNTIAGNQAVSGGAIYCTGSSPVIVNAILWSNTPNQIFQTSGSNLQIAYSDIQGVWPGSTNIHVDPLFVNEPQSDYHLQATSPCIDTGDPNVIYNDPDWTRADMGCYYYLHGTCPLNIMMTSINPPIQIPAPGGSFQYDLNVHNSATFPANFDLWIMMKQLPDGPWTGPYFNVNRTLAGNANPTRLRTQNIAGSLVAGTYLYQGWLGDYPSVAWDSSSFTFEKLAVGDGCWIGDFANTGKDFDDINSESVAPVPANISLIGNFPNPFNPTTTISFELPVSGFVNLSVYDISGKKLVELVNGTREAGSHQVTFDGSNLSTGIYFARLTSGGFSATQKLVFLK